MTALASFLFSIWDKIIPVYIKERYFINFRKRIRIIIQEDIIKNYQNLLEQIILNGGIRSSYTEYVIRSEALEGLFIKSITKGCSFTTKDIALILAHENELSIPTHQVIDLAHTFGQRLNDMVIKDKAMSTFLKPHFNDNLVVCILSDLHNTEFVNALSDLRMLHKKYYLNFSRNAKSDFHDSSFIRVYFDNEMGVVTWHEDYSIDVSFNNFKSDEIDIAFYTLGADYVLYQDGIRYSLSDASKDEYGNVCFNFGGKIYGKLEGSPEYLWIR